MSDTIQLKDFTRQVTLLQVTRTQDDAGQWIPANTDMGTVYAKVVKSAGESLQLDGIQQNNRLQVTIHRNDAIDNTWRLGYQGLQYNITAADPSEDQTIYTIIEAYATSDTFTG